MSSPATGFLKIFRQAVSIPDAWMELMEEKAIAG
jgi:hypothetical protein